MGGGGRGGVRVGRGTRTLARATAEQQGDETVDRYATHPGPRRHHGQDLRQERLLQLPGHLLSRGPGSGMVEVLKSAQVLQGTAQHREGGVWTPAFGPPTSPRLCSKRAAAPPPSPPSPPSPPPPPHRPFACHAHTGNTHWLGSPTTPPWPAAPRTPPRPRHRTSVERTTPVQPEPSTRLHC